MNEILEKLLEKNDYLKILEILQDLELDYNSKLQELDSYYSNFFIGILCILRKVVDARFLIKRTVEKNNDFENWSKIAEYLASFQFKKLHLLLQNRNWELGISLVLVKHLQKVLLEQEFNRLSTKYTSIDPRKVSEILGISEDVVGNYVRERNWDIDAKQGNYTLASIIQQLLFKSC